MTDQDENGVNRVAEHVLREMRRKQRMTSASWAVVAFAVILGYSVALFGLINAYGEARDDVRRVQTQVDANAERTDCRNDLSTRLSLAQGDYLAAFGDVVAAGFLSDQAADLDAALLELQALNDAYGQAIADRIAYEQAGAPLPCPLADTTTED